ncbi:MAG TPA: glycosyltransferase, partial [Bacillota bacterium]|nr:glycosyltransferase [Bacillota bacterium]
KEIMTDYYGYGMQRLLKARAGDVKGILNGIDMKEFNPVTDKLIAEKYGIDDYREGKIANRKALEDAITAHLPAGRPLVGIVSRLVSQKGIDLIKRVFDEMLETDDFSCVVLGNGQAEYEDYFKKLALDHPDRVFVRIGYDNKLAHLIYAASDIFLMPSKFEPCGLGQMIAMRYGSIPVVRETGGLSDTIQPFNEYVPSGNGFSFTNFNAHDMMHVLRYAFRLYRLQGVWNYLVKEAMSVDFSWQKSAKEYKKVYKQLLKNKEETI